MGNIGPTRQHYDVLPAAAFGVEDADHWTVAAPSPAGAEPTPMPDPGPMPEPEPVPQPPSEQT